MNKGRWTIRVVQALGCAIVLALALVPVAYAAVPSTPVIRDTWVSAVGKVSVRWDASVDASGHAVGYDIYRDTVPITSATIISRSLTPIISNYLSTTVQVNAASAETTQAYTWFYAVVAHDSESTPLFSVPSGNMAPNLHGYRNDSTIVSCGRCHQVHGAYLYDYRTKELCYTCHGNTSAAAPIGAKSTWNVQKEFADYDGQTLGSTHRNAYMTTNKTECTACHSAHRSSYLYDASGTYQAASSYRMMLRVKYGASLYNYYSKNSAPATANEFCLSCHGSTVVFDGKTVDAATSIGLAGGPSAFANTGGDHNTANYAASAHGGATIYSNDYDGSSATTDTPAVQCEVCHDNHGSATTRLVDYRRSHTTDADSNKQAGLCYKCHSASSTEVTVAAGFVKPFAWNGRDVQAEFARASHHPAYTVPGTWSDVTDPTFSHTIKAQFDNYTLTQAQTTNTVGGEIVLERYATSTTPPVRAMIYGSRGGLTTFSSYDSAGTTWDTTPADNTLFAPATGSSAFYANSRVYVTRGGSLATQAAYNPATNTWATAQTISESIGTGGDSVVNTSTADTAVYYTAAGGANSRIMWWNYTGITTGEFNFQVGGTDQTLGVGSAIAYAPDADRLFVLYQNATAGDGRLYYRTDPARSTTDVDFTSGQLTTSDAASRYARMTYFKKNGTEYLLVVGRNTSDVNAGMVITGLNGTPSAPVSVGYPFDGTTMNDGCDLEWDGGDYVYAFAGGSSTLYARAAIPADPTTAWTWTTLTASFAQDAGSSLAIAPYQAADIPGFAYRSNGTAVSTEILPYVSAHRWGTVSWTESEPAGTDLRVTVEGYNTGTTSWDTLASQIDASSIDLSAYTVAAYSKLRLTATLSTTDTDATPWLYAWSATSVYNSYVTASGSLTCVSCHNVHYTKAEKTSDVWDMDRASDPENTKNVVTSTTYGSAPSDFCMRCHDGVTTAATTTADVVVPYTAAFGPVTAPYFPGWNKNATGFKFVDSGHFAATTADGKALCETCHDPHGSNNKRLGAWTRPAGVTWASGLSIAGSRVNTGTAATEQNLCYKCHGNGTASYPRSNGAKDVYTKANLTYAHDPGDDTGAHADTETAALLGGTNRHAECTDCHDPHVTKKVSSSALHTLQTSNAGGAIYGAWGTLVAFNPSTWGAPSGYTPLRLSGTTGDYEAYLCFKCHSSNTAQPSGQTNTAQEFNPSNFSFHNVLGQSTGMQSSFTFADTGGTTRTVTWQLPPADNFLKTADGWNTNSMMTCTDCHTNAQTSATQASGPHGSSVEWIIDPDYPSDWRTTYLYPTTNGMSNTTNICSKCHDLSNGGYWSNTAHARTQHQNSTRGMCGNCHIATPHGWKRPRLLGYSTDGGAYATPAGTLSRINYGGYTTTGGSVQWSSDDCYASGCGAQHQSAFTPYWP